MIAAISIEVPAADSQLKLNNTAMGLPPTIIALSSPSMTMGMVTLLSSTLTPSIPQSAIATVRTMKGDHAFIMVPTLCFLISSVLGGSSGNRHMFLGFHILKSATRHIIDASEAMMSGSRGPI